MKLFASIALFLSFTTSAIAGDREATRVRHDVATDDAEARIMMWPPTMPWPFPFPFPFPRPFPGPFDPYGMETVNVEYQGSAEGFRGSHQYDFAVEGNDYTVEVRNSPRSSLLVLRDAEDEVVVGYSTSDRGAVIFDHDGLVSRGAPGEIDITTIEDYGLTATLLTNPVILQSILAANGETFEGDDDPPAYWIWPALAAAVRCIQASVTVGEDGVESFTFGWDC